MIASVFVGASVDGFIARADGDPDWLPDGDSLTFGQLVRGPLQP